MNRELYGLLPKLSKKQVQEVIKFAEKIVDMSAEEAWTYLEKVLKGEREA